ncbi:hypothetical protein Acsp05_19270 [Actinokineospora sp. NBRC 105648]|nr:hypothetical protein Acsp05_19270 [Actinokineospora sp. NBRC 105648]
MIPVSSVVPPDSVGVRVPSAAAAAVPVRLSTAVHANTTAPTAIRRRVFFDAASAMYLATYPAMSYVAPPRARARCRDPARTG